MEALYYRAKLLQHGAQSPDTPGAPAQPFNISAQTHMRPSRLTTTRMTVSYDHMRPCFPPWNTGCKVWEAPAVLLEERTSMVEALGTLQACADEYTLPRMLTTASPLSLGACSRSHSDNLFIQQFPQNPATLYLGLLYENTGITFNFINSGTLDERCCRKPATSVCCIHFSAGSTYSSCLMMLIRAASFTDKCVFGRIHHPEWVFLMGHRSACFTLSSIR